MHDRDHVSSLKDVRPPSDGQHLPGNDLGLQLQPWHASQRMSQTAARFGNHARQIEADVLRNFARFAR